MELPGQTCKTSFVILIFEVYDLEKNFFLVSEQSASGQADEDANCIKALKYIQII